MKIQGFANQISQRVSFRGDEDLRDIISKKIKEAMENPQNDTFTPSSPSQPIIIEKLEIKQGESKEDKNTLLKGGASAGGAAVGGAGVAKTIGKDDEESKPVDTKKIIEDQANESMSGQKKEETVETEDTKNGDDNGDDDDDDD